jgi:hypothetical protein
VSYVLLPIYGPDAATHDSITCAPGSFDDLVAGVDAVRELGGAVAFTTLALRQNLARLPALAAFVAQRFAARIVVRQPFPRADSAADYAEVMPPFTDVISTLAGHDLILGHFPLCVRRQVEGWRAPERLADRAGAPFARSRGPLEEGVPGGSRPKPHYRQPVKPEWCAPCALHASCPGTYALYLELYGTAGLVHLDAAGAPRGAA